MNFQQIISTYIWFCWNDRWLFLLAFLAGTGASALASRVPQVTADITMHLAASTAYASLLRDLVIYHVASSIFAAVRGRLFSDLIRRIHRRVCNTALDFIVGQPLSVFETREGISDILTHHIESYSMHVTLNTNMLSRSMVSMFMMLGFMMLQSPVLTLNVIIMCAARMAVFRYYEKTYNERCEKVHKKREDMFNIVREYITHIVTIRFFARDEWYVQQYNQACDDIVEAKAFESRGYSIFLFIGQILEKSVFVATLIAGSRLNIPAVKMIYFLSYQNSVLDQLNTFVEVYKNGVNTKDVYEKVNGVLQEAMAVSGRDAEGHKAPPDNWDIQFEDVSFAYPTRPEKWVLEDFDLIIPQGSSCMVRGRSGSGKSTIIKLIAGFYHPQKGSVLLGGSPLSGYARSNLFKFIAFVPQEPILFRRSIRDNIAFGVECDDATVEEVCKEVGLHEFVTGLPRGYDTPCGSQQGMQFLSGGQKQRVAIARVLVRSRHTRILLLDEPVSALDDQTSDMIIESLDKRFFSKEDATKIMISHNTGFLSRLHFDTTIDIAPRA